MNDQPEPTTVHGRGIAHMQLASRWLQLNGRKVNETTLHRVMQRYDAETLRCALDAAEGRSAS